MKPEKNNVTLLYVSVHTRHSEEIQTNAGPRVTPSPLFLYYGVQWSGGRGHKARLRLVQSLTDSLATAGCRTYTWVLLHSLDDI